MEITTVAVYALEEPSRKEVDTHNGKDEPEYHDNQKYVADRRYSLDEGIHHHLSSTRDTIVIARC